EFGAKLIYDLAMQGDAQAQEIFRIVGNALGVVLADLVNLFNIPMYVIGGGVASAWSAFAPTMMETVRRNSFVYRATAPAGNATGSSAKNGAVRASIIAPAKLGSDAGLIGAARMPMMARETASAR
ncbi:MAG TPA: ROK family protein, partial [Candidatus Angelobacter sp.]|nr:ROK family protein [Candidatus Angelobacter sp.]